ncbi:TPA: hypothetical protein ACX6Q6_002272 [Photobacterium damselae]
MTYSIAWKTDTAAFIVTDSVVTTVINHPRELNGTTSFLEQQGKLDNDKYAYEGAYKIFSKSNIAYSLAGDANFGSTFINDIMRRVEIGLDIKSSINGAIDNYPNFKNKPSIEVTIAFYDEHPQLVTVKNKRSTYVEFEDGLVLTGSPTEKLVDYTKTFHASFIKDYLKIPLESVSDEELLVKMIALLQSYGIHNYTIENGIGGTYTGLSVTSSGVKYQPDICYLITGENSAFDSKKLAAVNANEHFVYIINTDISDIVISNSNIDITEPYLASFLDGSRKKFDRGEYKYIILLNTYCHVVCVVNMNFSRYHSLLSLDVRDNQVATLGLVISDELNNILNDGYKVPTRDQKTKFNYIPFIPASEPQINLVRHEITKLRVGNISTPAIPKYKFILMESENQIDWYYGNQDSIIPFLKYNKDQEFIRIVDIITDMVVLEFNNGNIIYPDFGCNTDELFINVIDKERKEDIYIFEFYPNNGGDEFLYVHVLAINFDDALRKAKLSVYNEYGYEPGLIFSGKQFYHPKYFQ